MIELAQEFGFEAAHSLRRAIETEASLRIHGHSYGGVLVLRGDADPDTGMLVDLGEVTRVIEDLRRALDHRLLDEVAGLGAGTMENLARWIYERAKPALPALARVEVRRASLGQSCAFEP